ncbi:HNH endonuclease [Clostridium aceticum]|uniref:HNH endonuclease n=1 Tax=Clostridium aceticum TaxID=84022 RepID=A0A0D8I8X0_9CLOT|nr:HNH endonuclease signature motif containing protein [Clostridium aceticum]AKL95765.1 HNH endonuclease [Clostridium aceticum]KJF25686.1 hypothetical protein TZ02_17470 [Clostridium aceticum]
MDMNALEAAIYMKMSPKLLEWFANYAPKYNDNRKLRISKTEDGILFYTRGELDEFNDFLSQAWPSKEGVRPAIPAGIQREIKGESRGVCAICGSDLGEFAHIDPVHNSKNNHPHNLIYLCPNCHTKYDNKHFYTLKEIREIKDAILKNRVIIWKAESDLINSIIALTIELKRIKENKKCSSAHIYNELNDNILKEIREAVNIDSSEMNNNLPKYRDVKKYNNLKDRIKKVLKEHENLEEEIIQETEEYLIESNETLCPLCKGSGTHNSWECPICRGVGTVDRGALEDIDLSDYKQEECPLCKGKGTHNNWECPICIGVGTVDHGALEDIDLSDYRQEECLLCKGKGTHNNWECPICIGVGTVDHGALEDIDLSDYKQEECPLCKGKGTHNNWECPICRGVGTVDRGALEDIDLSDYKQEECPLCKGKGIHNNWECPICRGVGTVDRGALEDIDLSDYK